MTIFASLRPLARIALPVALTLLLAGVPLAAEEAASPMEAVEADPHADLYDAMRGGIDNQVVLDNLIGSIVAELVRQVPEFELLEAEKPGLLAAMGQSIRPVLADYSNRVQETYQPRMIGLFKEGLSAEEAGQLAAFYRSDMGRKLLTGVSNGYTGTQTLRGALDNPEGDIPVENIATDIKSASIKAYLGLTTEERAALDDIAANTPAFAKLTTIQPRINALRHEMENAPMLPEEEARLNGTINTVFEKYLGDLGDK